MSRRLIGGASYEDFFAVILQSTAILISTIFYRSGNHAENVKLTNHLEAITHRLGSSRLPNQSCPSVNLSSLRSICFAKNYDPCYPILDRFHYNRPGMVTEVPRKNFRKHLKQNAADGPKRQVSFVVQLEVANMFQDWYRVKR